MQFNRKYYKLLESFTAPTDTKRPARVRSRGKYGTINPQLNDPHSTQSISGFKGQPGGKSGSMFFSLPSSDEESKHEPVKPGILKKRLGKLSCTKVRKEKSKLKNKGTHYAKALQRYLNYHC